MSKKLKYIGLGLIGFVIIVVLANSGSPAKDVQKESIQSTVTNQNDIKADTTTKQDRNSQNNPQTTTNQNEIKTKPTVQQNLGSQSNQQVTIESNQSSASCTIVNYLPDPDCTPGAIDSRVTQENINSTICVSGYTATVRPSTSITSKIKIERMKAYGFTDSPGNYELDHLISLELGGSPDSVLNLFPEPYANPFGAREKDKVENYLHDQICDGKITLKTAQQEISTNWVVVYNNYCSAKSSAITQTPLAEQKTNTASVVKMSSTGICHAPGTTYYDRTTIYTVYNSIDECLADGGRLPKN